MTAVNDPRNTVDASQTAATASKDAALRGALRAFAGSHTRSLAPDPAVSRNPSLTNSVAVSYGLRPKTSHVGNLSSNLAASPVTPSSIKSPAAPATLRSKHPTSRPATAVAASRLSQNTSTSSHNVAFERPMRKAHGGSERPTAEPSSDVLPSAGTVHGTKDYFESLQGKMRNTANPGDGSSTSVLPHTLNTPQPRPHLSIDVGAAVAKAQGLPAEIQSPKPIRPSLGARPLENLTEGRSSRDEGVPTLMQHGVKLPSMHAANDRRPSLSTQHSITTAIADSRIPTASNYSSAQVLRPPPIQRSATVSHSMRPRSAEGQLSRPKRGSPYAGSSEQSDAHRIDSLANAIVASHLAASRAPSRTESPSKVAKPPLPRRRTDHPSILHSSMASHVSKQDARTPSPKKGIRQTMRKPPTPVDPNAELADKHKRSHFRMRKHPHKHREGDRKRWRDEITEVERKRYDGLWAANKDLHISLMTEEIQPFSQASKTEGYVSGLVIRDIWSRSRLPAHVLEEIWELVDLEGVGRLSREAFVVGMWLVDQRLKGRKLPVKVGDSVWHSARGIYGLKMPRIKS